MTALPIRDLPPHQPEPVRRIYKYLVDNPGAQPRDSIMRWTGFSPAAEPIMAYVRFANAIDGLNRALTRQGVVRVAGGLAAREHYWLEAI